MPSLRSNCWEFAAGNRGGAVPCALRLFWAQSWAFLLFRRLVACFSVQRGPWELLDGALRHGKWLWKLQEACCSLWEEWTTGPGRQRATHRTHSSSPGSGLGGCGAWTAVLQGPAVSWGLCFLCQFSPGRLVVVLTPCVRVSNHEHVALREQSSLAGPAVARAPTAWTCWELCPG